MSSLANILLDKEILLESGTNELEVLVFNVADYTFGINVAKVREVLPAVQITSLPKAHRSIRGVFKLRSQVVPCVSLLEHLGIQSTVEGAESKMILTDLNQQQTAFLVDSVERIHRLSWENILAVPGLDALSRTPVTALARCSDRLVVMLDFEMILDDVTSQYFRTDVVANPLGLPRERLRILMAEDSPTVRQAVASTLQASGYQHLTFFENGAEAWDWIEKRLAEVGRLEDVGDLLICDVEMPQVDGFHLTKRIKQHPVLKGLPVLLYSSIITPDNRKKGSAVGADAQVAKPELREVVRLADELIAKAQHESRSAALREIAGTTSAPAKPQPQLPAAQIAPRAEAAERRVQPPAPTTATPAVAARSQPRSPVPVEPGAGAYVAETPVPPQGVDPRLWRTFHQELTDRARHLHAMLDRAEAGDRSRELFTEVLRTLHTIKSAAMVIPLDPATRLTHLAEGLVAAVRDGDQDKWPQARLRCYLDWLDELASPGNDTNQTLAAAVRLEGELAA
jgi:two-component system chemotaxis response regulator CheV